MSRATDFKTLDWNPFKSEQLASSVGSGSKNVNGAAATERKLGFIIIRRKNCAPEIFPNLIYQNSFCQTVLAETAAVAAAVRRNEYQFSDGAHVLEWTGAGGGSRSEKINPNVNSEYSLEIKFTFVL